MADEYKLIVKDLSFELDKASKAMGDISRLQKGMIKGFTEITKTSTATGQAWISVSRFFSGSGFWRIQNKVKALSNALQFAQKMEEKRNEQEDKRMKQLAENEENLKTVVALQDQMNKALDGTIKQKDYESLVQNRMFKLYKAEHGHKMAVLLLQQKITKSVEKGQEYEKEGGKVRERNFTKRLKEVTEIAKQVKFGHLTDKKKEKLQERLKELNAKELMTHGMNLKTWQSMNSEGKQFSLHLKDIKDEHESLKDVYDQEVLENIEKEVKHWDKKKQEFDRQKAVMVAGHRDLESRSDLRGATAVIAAGGTTDEATKSDEDIKNLAKDKERIRRRLAEISADLHEEHAKYSDELTESLQGLQDKITDKFDEIQAANLEFDIRADTSGAKKVDTGQIDPDTGEPIMEKGFKQSSTDVAAELWGDFAEWGGGIWDSLQNQFKLLATFGKTKDKLTLFGSRIKSGLTFIFNPKNAKSIGKFVGKGLRLIGKFFLWFSLIMLFVLFAKQAGIIDFIVKIGKQAMEGMALYGEKIMEFVVVLFEWFAIAFEFIEALLFGTAAEATEAAGVLIEKTIELAVKLWTNIIWPIIVGVFWVIYTAAETWWHEHFIKGKSAAQVFFSKLFGLIGLVGGLIVGANLASGWGKLSGIMFPIFMGIAGSYLGGVAGSSFAAEGGMGGYASGGGVGRTGTYLVGERGPEMVKLPAGAHVYNNSNTQGMRTGNVINVNVNGRVGASDAELRDIANKIGRMVNMEVNRNTNIGVRGA